jgi:tRNA nucleotidyltransferase/poly(A) polymerase
MDHRVIQTPNDPVMTFIRYPERIIRAIYMCQKFDLKLSKDIE